MKLMEIAPIKDYPFCAQQELVIPDTNLKLSCTIFYQNPFKNEFSQSVINRLIVSNDGKEVLVECYVLLFDKRTRGISGKIYLLVGEDFVESSDEEVEKVEENFLAEYDLTPEFYLNDLRGDENWQPCADPRLG